VFRSLSDPVGLIHLYRHSVDFHFITLGVVMITFSCTQTSSIFVKLMVGFLSISYRIFEKCNVQQLWDLPLKQLWDFPLGSAL